MPWRRALPAAIGLLVTITVGCTAGTEIAIIDARLPDSIIILHEDPAPEIDAQFVAQNRGPVTAEGCRLGWRLNGERADTTREPEATTIRPGESGTLTARASVPASAFPGPIVSEALVQCSNARSPITETTIGVGIE